MCLALDVEDDEADADEEDADEEQLDSAGAGGGGESKAQTGYEAKYHAFLNKAHLRLTWLHNPP